jgi:S1-C subfamily serine protease
MNSPGMTMADIDGGIEVRTVAAGGMADQAGLRAGDLVLRVGGVPVFSIAEVWVLMREHHPGATLEIEYVRGGERLHGVGVLSDEWSPVPVANPSR